MKKINKIIIFILMMLVLSYSSLKIFADDAMITFEGYSSGFDIKAGSEYTDTDMFNNFKNVMPGDTLTEVITFTNNASDFDYINLYLKIEPHSDDNPLSEKVALKEDLSSMMDFLSKLHMSIYVNDELIYDEIACEVGDLTNNKFLAKLYKDEKAIIKVILEVPLSLDNKYASRTGEIDWIFHIEGFNEDQLSIRKVWSDGNHNHQNDEVTINLLKDGEIETTQILNASNNWAYTFEKLDSDYKYTIEEVSSFDGYDTSYQTEGNLITIINNKKETPPEEIKKPLNLTVYKKWSNDDENKRPEYITVTLFNGEEVVENVRLGAFNNWSYTWTHENLYGNWQVLETNIPKGYVPTYSLNGNELTITNTYSLIYTGNNNYYLYLVGIGGLALVLIGLFCIKKK